jgi:hypothetical protein
MCIALKYGIWNVSKPGMEAVNTLAQGGYSPLAAMVLASRGICDGHQADAYLNCGASLIDPMCMTDMDKAVARVRLAMSRGEKVGEGHRAVLQYRSMGGIG